MEAPSKEKLSLIEKIREDLKRFSLAEIAKGSGLPIDKVATFMDGNSDISNGELIALSIFSAESFFKKKDGECDCPICRLKRGEIPNGIHVMEIKIERPKTTDENPQSSPVPPASPAPRPNIFKRVWKAIRE